MAGYTIGDIAKELGAEAAGDLNVTVHRVREPQNAAAGDLALAMEESYAEALTSGAAEAAVVWTGADWQKLGLKAAIFAPRSRYVLSGVTHVFEKPPEVSPGIHPSAIIDPTAIIGENASIGPFVVVGARAKIGANARILSHTSISEDAEIGVNALLYQSVRIGARVRIGDDFTAQSGAVIGSDGFSFVTPKPGAVEEARATGAVTTASRTEGFARINSLGTVVIGHRVEVGANSAIDRGTIANTTIGDGTKIDNLVQIGHNVTVGQHCLLCGQSGIAGSTKLGDRVVLGGQSAVADHTTVGSDVIVAGKSGVSSNVPPGRVMMGNPAMRMDLNVESYKAIRRLPRLVAKVEKLEKTVFKDDENE